MNNYSNSNSKEVSPVFCDSVIITQVSDSSKFMAGAVADVSPAQTTIPQLVATAYLNGAALSPQPSFKWTTDSTVATVDQSGNVTRRAANPNASSFDSNGAVSTGQLGSIVTVRATYLRQDGSESGVFGEIKISVQAAGFRYIAPGSPQSVINPIRNIVLLQGITNKYGVVDYDTDAPTYPNSNDN